MNKTKIAAFIGLFIASQAPAYAVGTGLPFTIDEANVPGILAASIVNADSADFSYNAIINQTNDITVPGLNADAFTEAGFFTVSSFKNGVASQASSLNGPAGLGGYGLYGIFNVSGSATSTPAGLITASFSTGTLSIYLDENQSGANGGVVSPGDILLGSASLLNAGSEAHLFGGLANGDFELVWGDWLLTSGNAGLDGDEYFVNPNPFHMIINFNGNTTSVTPPGSLDNPFTSVADGSGNIFFNRVPEPGTLALLGLGLMGASIRKRK